MESTIDRARSYCARGRATGGCARGLSSLTMHRAALVGWLLGGWLFAAGIAFAQPDPSPPEMLEDAELTAITFLDADRGWAVGDRGVIWHTRDGGRNWQRQNSSTTCRLEAIQFLDANVGYAVGGWTQPYTHETHGVVLRTRDGGQTWQNIPGLVLPGLAHAKFFDARNGWALGDGSPLYPSGIFRTDDGARTWIPVPKGESTGWVTGDFRDAKTGVAAGLGGTLGLVTQMEIRPTRTENLGARYLRRMLLAGELGGWLVGDGGLALTTKDGGFTWTAPPGRLPEIAAAELDFRALAVHGSHVWMAGAPGTCVLHSADQGQTWQVQRTEQTAPLRGLCFLDESRGWAVGAFGTILHTRDGGQSWRVQRSGGKRVALLGIFSEPERVPLAVVAQQAGSDAYLTAVEILGRRDLEPAAPPNQRTLPRRTHGAVIAAGGSAADTAWRFPLRDEGLVLSADAVLARWNTANDGRATDRMEEHLVRRIRQWRPEVIVTEDVSPRGDDPQGHLTNQITLAAVAKAADPTAYSDQISQVGLTAWKVKKVFALARGDRGGVVTITPAQWAPRLGRSLAETAESGSRLISADLQPVPKLLGLSLLVDHLPQQAGRRDVMSGIVLSAGSEARRALSSPPGGNLDLLSRMAQRRHNVEQLLSRIHSGDPSTGTWIGQIDNLTSELPSRQSSEILWQLGQRYMQVGKGQAAAESMHALIHRYPQEPLAEAAAVWLIQYHASGELAWRNRKATHYSVQLASATSQREDARGRAVATTDKAGAPLEVVDRSQQTALVGQAHVQTAAPDLSPDERASQAIAVADWIKKTRPTLHAAPQLQFPLSIALRQAGQSRSAEQYLQRLGSGEASNPWAACVSAESWLLAKRGVAPKTVMSVAAALERPKLDGLLDEPLWRIARPIPLASASADSQPLATHAVLAYDEEFLYFAASCQKAPGGAYAPVDATAPRPHDSDLAAVDHLSLLLDIDRDYSTYWQLSVDPQGRPAASCFGDATWNPQWFIATAGDAQWWTVEAAIPLAELGGRRPQSQDAWAAQVQRVVPDRGVVAASQPAAAKIRPEGFGLLLFD
jgi:photosystem II stability/assembly factor-like uncharacterized protein